MARRGPARGIGVLAIAALVAACGVAPSGPPVTPTRPTASPSPSSAPTPTATPTLISKAEAEAAARAVSERWKDGTLLDARFGRYQDFRNEYAATATPVPGPDGPVWWINLGYDPGPLMGQGEVFVIDATDGHVIQHYDWIS